MLINSIRNPKISVHAMLEGTFTTTTTKPLSPPVTRVIFHKKYNIRLIWGQNGLQVWYIEPTIDN